MFIYLQGRTNHLVAFPLVYNYTRKHNYNYSGKHNYAPQPSHFEIHIHNEREPEKFNGPKNIITYSGRRTASTRTEGEGVRRRGRRAYGAASVGESTRTGLLKCLAESGRPGQIPIVMALAHSNHTPFLLLLQFFGTNRIRVGCARHGLAGAADTDIIGGIAWNHRHWKIVTLLQGNGIRVRLRYSSQKFELGFCDCHYICCTLIVFAL